jgi:predicted RecB family nuclease
MIHGIMDASNSITAAVFLAFLKCPTKAHLLARGETIPDAFFTDTEARISWMYKSLFSQTLRVGGELIEPLDFSELRAGRCCPEAVVQPVDCKTAIYNFALPSCEPKGRPSQEAPSGTFVPLSFTPWDKPDASDKLLVCFGALALSQVTGNLPDVGTLIYGEEHRRKAVKIGDHIAQTQQAINAIDTTCYGPEPPTLVLNRHCAVCDFQARCRRLAIERDDLSLLSAMTAKERAKSNAKGVVTITQLSYSYRPRRRKRTRPDADSSKKSNKRAPLVRNDHNLKALAVKKKQIHVVGAPSLTFNGTPTFLDVEGMPDRNFYYLIGLRFSSGGEQVERSFWADGLDDERQMWEDCMRELKAIGNAQIVSYGAYETRFLKQMKARYALAPEDVEFVDGLIETSINLVSFIYGKVYFPTYSNNLKEVARYLGFEWTWPQASGAAAPFLRRAWELSADDGLKRKLIEYNMEDCRAAAKVKDAVVQLWRSGSSLDAVDIRSLEVDFSTTFGKFDSALPEFAKINDAAYWDYQRSRVYVRTNKVIRQIVRQSQGGSKSTTVERQVTAGEVPEKCTRCRSTKFWTYRGRSQIVYDLRFTRRGIKRCAVRYSYCMYRCSECRADVTTYSRSWQFGPHLCAFITYLLIELRLSNQKAAEHASTLFDLPLKKSNAIKIKAKMAEKYMPTYRSILQEIANGVLVHADETKGVVKGGGHYVWVFANLTTVAYVYAESREAAIVGDLLGGFRGVLVSDFYAAYDSVPCAQQKCLIHLMRDINEDLQKNPFDSELKEIAGRFGSLLRKIVETIDANGLKARYLAKHKQSAMGFIEHVVGMKCSTEAGVALAKRIEKNKDKLFTFLDHDGVPWNNNNAEHAVRAFARLRNVMISSTPKGTREFATLMSIQQTLHYRGMSFLEFLRSGKMDIGSSGDRTGANAATDRSF